MTDALVLSAGARFGKSTYAVEEENAAKASIADDDDTHREQAYHLGLTWSASETTKLFARYEHFYRFPFTDEQISYSGFGSSFNKSLDPETGDSYEIGIEQRLPGGVTVAASLFRMEMQDEIAYVFPNNVNLDETVHQGVELSLRANPSAYVSLHGNYTLQEIEFDAGANAGNEIPLVPKHKLGGGVEVCPFEALRVNLDATYTSPMYGGGDNGNSQPRIGDYVVVDFGLAYTIASEKTTWEIFGGIDNLLDEKYTDFVYSSVFYTGYYPSPGRTYKVGLKASF